jgi:CheY-like chemotaxis protein
VVVNLVGNAIKFTDAGEVVLHVEQERPSDGTVTLHFAVTDTGVGIPQDKQGQLFKAFAQVDASTTRRFGGTGLGLAISARLVRMMGGRIWMDSESGKGSTFHFTAQFELARNGRRAPAPERVDLDGLPVLVVDDNATNRFILTEMLTNWRMKPTPVGNAADALVELQLAKQTDRPFGLVLIDSMMPGVDGFMLVEQIRRDEALIEHTIMMLTSADRHGDAARCRELGIATYLVKPVRQSALLDAIVTALGVAAGKEPGAEAERPPAAEPVRSLSILVAEDNVVNQLLAQRLLEKRGHRVTVAGNGRVALDLLERRRFDVVLMDVQMPELDGFEATNLIREKERERGGHVPVIAMTAHAMKGDRERCLAAGMDGYIAKPLRSTELMVAIDELCFGGAEARGLDGEPTSEPLEELFNESLALQQVEGDTDLLRQLVEVFLAECPRWLDELASAIVERDAARLQQVAHKLKGAVGNFGAAEVATTAAELEFLGRAGKLDGADALYRRLTKLIERLRPALNTLVPVS